MGMAEEKALLLECRLLVNAGEEAEEEEGDARAGSGAG